MQLQERHNHVGSFTMLWRNIFQWNKITAEEVFVCLCLFILYVGLFFVYICLFACLFVYGCLFVFVYFFFKCSAFGGK